MKKETVELLMEKGNNSFLAGKQTDAMLNYLKALEKARAFEQCVKYVWKYKENLFDQQLMLQQLLFTKYHIQFVPGALPFFLITLKNQLQEMEMKKEYQRFKKLILSHHPKTVEQTIETFLDEFETPSNKEKNFLSKVLQEYGYNYSILDITRLCNLRTNPRKLEQFERSLNWRHPTSFTDIDAMTGYEFEDFVVDLFIKLGYIVEKRKRSHEQGLDLLLIKHGVRIAVQVKRYKRPVGNRGVQQAISACVYYNCQKAIVVTNSTFTTPAKQLAARSGNVELWDRTVLKEKIKNLL